MVEFAIVGPLFILLVMGIIEFALVAQAWATLQHASLEGARYASTGQTDCTGITGNRLSCISQTTKAATNGIPGGGVGSGLIAVTIESWQYPAYASPSVTNDAGGACDAVQVRVDYTHQIIVPLLTFVAPSGIPLAAQRRTLVEPINTCGA
jgi:Flp pilus assembly protein TadG